MGPKSCVQQEPTSFGAVRISNMRQHRPTVTDKNNYATSNLLSRLVPTAVPAGHELVARKAQVRHRVVEPRFRDSNDVSVSC